jgi:hypothetical protein
MHMENYPLTWFRSEKKSKANAGGNSTDVPHAEYQDYMNTNERY